jgi:outer membrane receptor for ferrienterochelin and colicins
MRYTHGVRLLVAVLSLWFTAPLAAQNGTLTGRVTDTESGQPLDGAQVQVVGGGEATGGLTNAEGIYRIQLPAGTYSVVVEFLGFVTGRQDGVTVRAGQTTTVDIQLESTAVALDPIVYSASRGQPEKLVDAPATTYLVGTVEIQERLAPSPVEHLRSAPGVDIISEGVQSSNVVVRGFNNIFSGSLHFLTDHRLAGVPSLRVNLLHFIPSNNDDIERMEVVLGPGSALYGPNTANGVLHITTRSPLDSTSSGTTVTLGGGEQSVFQGSFRSSVLVNRNLGIKISGQYLRGNEWPYTDKGEEAARMAALENPAQCVGGIQIRGYTAAEALEACGRVGTRDFDLERYGLEARADYRFAEDGTAILTYGRTSASGIELTGLGAGQTENWIYQFFQARMNKGRFFTQAYLNTSDAGNSWLLRDGVDLIDNSKLYVAQVQHGFSLWEDRQDFTYGFDYFGTRPDTKGSINGSYEDKDNMDEWGVYLQSKTVLSPKFDLVLAGRMDSHSMLPEEVFSPRAALVFKPTEDQSFRVTYNRAFSTPSSLNFFLDISAGAAPNEALAALGYTLRAFGTGSSGYGFQNPDGSLRGMRSPFTPANMGGPSQLIPADPAIMWQMAMGVLNAQGALASLPPKVVAALAGLTPTSGDVGIMVLNPSTGAVTPLSATTIPGVPGITESYTETYEVGWQGVVANKFRFMADVYYSKYNDFVSPLLVVTPLLLLNGQETGAFIQAPVYAAFYETFLDMGLPPEMAAAQAQAATLQTVPAVAGGVAQIPLGVVSSEGVAAQGADMIVTYRNVGNIDLWGADLGFSWFVDDKWTVNGTYSRVSDDWFEIEDGDPIALNAPKNKGSLGVAYRNVLAGLNAEARVRFNDEFPAESAGYVGTKCVPGAASGGLFAEECVEAFTLVDLNLGYKLPTLPATLQLSVTNLFNTPYRSFVGVPDIGRFAMVSMKYDFF